MHWLRGAGLAGLRGMLPATPLASLRIEPADSQAFADSNISIIRPLLEVPRAEIASYCTAHGLQPRFDRSNLDTTYFRNRLRHKLIPLLEEYNPQFREVLRRSARIIADDYELLRTLADHAWTQISLREDDRSIAFDLRAWRQLHPSLQRSTIREAIHRLRRSLRNISWIHVENAVVALRDKPVGTRVTLPRGLTLSVNYDQFIIADADYVPSIHQYPQLHTSTLPVPVPGSVRLPSADWQIESRLIQREAYEEQHLTNRDPWQAFLDYEATGGDLFLRRRLPGDRFQPLGLGGHEQRIRDFMINVRIPQPARERFPLLASPLGIIWIPGWRIDTRAKITKHTRTILHVALRRLLRRRYSRE